uniref:Fe2OG dioxygenase domain-containing protein n=1 Tax=Chromera velia CCMP2878 TaxID=1169474 RepID=A0A0G4IDI1_9ALVE|eukprot:Cvel_13301.t1-p1 / transcript=Cvel_13301.t1 / gene=Cvel_13301 / organism=Chromera_velia_CCMP2878 / gene_product=hypothetical protein / transcript_product=hypothetical protein / location=Cvel_scaffold903:2497-6278(+) / protein_length=453 / sequence_SO=supercontig / SO=protein_coding / is_pseudo=false
MEALLEAKKFIQNRTKFATSLIEKPNIWELDLLSLKEAELKNAAPLLDSFFRKGSVELIDRLTSLLPSLNLGNRNDGRTVKLQFNAGRGGCFPCHYDNAGPPSRRRLSCLVYLNPLWQEGDGGEIALLPFLQRETKVPPLHNRAVLFLSDRILHAVRPSWTSRFCFTLWVDAVEGKVNTPEETLLKMPKEVHAALMASSPSGAEEGGEKEEQTRVGHAEKERLGQGGEAEAGTLRDFVQWLQKSPVQRALSRYVYADEYLRSLKDCMGETGSFGEMVRSHEGFLESVEKNALMWRLCSFLRKVRSQVEAEEEEGHCQTKEGVSNETQHSPQSGSGVPSERRQGGSREGSPCHQSNGGPEDANAVCGDVSKQAAPSIESSRELERDEKLGVNVKAVEESAASRNEKGGEGKVQCEEMARRVRNKVEVTDTGLKERSCSDDEEEEDLEALSNLMK